jgi:hypothetical protein
MKTKKYDMKGGSGLKTKKYDMKGGMKILKTLGTQAKKAAIGTGKLLKGPKWTKGKGFNGLIYRTKESYGKRQVIPTQKARAAAAVAKGTVFVATAGIAPAVLGAIPAYYVGKRIYKGTRGIWRGIALTRSGKAQKEMRQETGITDLGYLKRKSEKMKSEKEKYADRIAKIKVEIDAAKNTDPAKIKSKTNKLIREEGKLHDIGLKEQEIMYKWKKHLDHVKKKAENRKSKKKSGRTNKTTFEIKKNSSIENAIKNAEKHYENVAKKKKQDKLNTLEIKKKLFNETKNPLEEKRQTMATATVNYLNIYKTGTSQEIKDKKNAMDQAIKAYKTLETTEYKNIVQREKDYLEAQKQYNKQSKKASTLTNLSRRSKESKFKSIGRALTIPDYATRIRQKFTRKGNLLKSANVDLASASEEQKKDATWITTYWQKKDKATRQKKELLERYIKRGEGYLNLKGTKKIIDPDSGKKTSQTKTLKEIVEEGLTLPQGQDISTVKYKEFLEHIDKLESENKISPREHTILQKYHKAKRINAITAQDSNKNKKLTTDIETQLKTLTEIKNRIGSYDPIKQVLPTAFKKNFGTDKDAISPVKLLTLFTHEVEKNKIELETNIDQINKLPDTDKYKARQIAELYAKYGLVDPPTSGDIDITKFEDNKVIEYISSKSPIFSDGTVNTELKKLIKDTTDIANLKTKLETETKQEATAFIKEKSVYTTQNLDAINIKLQGATFTSDEGKKVKAATLFETALSDEKLRLADIISNNDLNEISQLKDLGLLELDTTGNPKLDPNTNKPILITDETKLAQHIYDTNIDVKTAAELANITADRLTKVNIDTMKGGLKAKIDENNQKIDTATTEKSRLEADQVYIDYKAREVVEDQRIKDLNEKEKTDLTAEIVILTGEKVTKDGELVTKKNLLALGVADDLKIHLGILANPLTQEAFMKAQTDVDAYKAKRVTDLAAGGKLAPGGINAEPDENKTLIEEALTAYDEKIRTDRTINEKTKAQSDLDTNLTARINVGLETFARSEKEKDPALSEIFKGISENSGIIDTVTPVIQDLTFDQSQIETALANP